MNKYSVNKIKGATMIEYVLIAGLIAAVAAALITTVGTSVQTVFTQINTALKNA